MSTWTLNSLDLGYVQRENFNKDAGLITLGIPTQDSKDALVFDFSGAEERWTVEGLKTFTTTASAQNFVYKGSGGTGSSNSPASDSLKGLISGNQSTSIAYVSDFYSTTNVKIGTVDVTLDEGIAYTIVRYRLSLIQTTVDV